MSNVVFIIIRVITIVRRWCLLGFSSAKETEKTVTSRITRKTLELFEMRPLRNRCRIENLSFLWFILLPTTFKILQINDTYSIE